MSRPRSRRPSPHTAGRGCGGLAGPLLGGVLGEHGIEDHRDWLHDRCLFVWAARVSWRGLEAYDYVPKQFDPDTL